MSGQDIVKRRSPIDNGKRVDNKPEPCRIPLFIGLSKEQDPSTTANIDWPEKKLDIKVQKE